MIALALLLATQASVAAPAATESELVELRALHDNADCDKVIARTVDEPSDPSDDARRELMFIRGDCLVTIGNIRQASDLFKRVMLDAIDAKPPFDVEPRVAILIEAARAEVARLRADEAAAARRKLIDKIGIVVKEPVELKGGSRAMFDVELVDPDAIVRSMRVDFRKRGAPEFYALPVERRIDGTWRGEIPGTYTKSAKGAVLEWYVTASDATGERLKSVGTHDAPLTLPILPGSVIALDLKANERVDQLTRTVVGVVVTPMFTLAGVLGGSLVGLSVLYLAQSPIAAAIVMATVPLIGGIVGSGVVANAVLDPADTVLVMTVVGSFLAVGGAFFASTIVIVGSDVLLPFVGGLAFTGLGLAAGAIAVPVLVAFDAPEE